MVTRILIELCLFYGLILAQILWEKREFPYFHKSVDDWVIDIVSLMIQGLFIPIVGMTLLYRLYSAIWPAGQGIWDLHPIGAFFLSFVFVDYVYYWVHRALHHRSLWFLHALHHSARDMDILNTSRNSLLTHLVLPYIWLNSIFIYLLKDPAAYILAFSITAMLDLWRHSKLYPEDKTWPWLERFLITPRAHGWHHSTTQTRSYYGANLVWWDQLHGSARPELLSSSPPHYGMSMPGEWAQRLLFPWQSFKRGRQQ